MFSINCLEITVTKNQWESKIFQDNHRDIYKNLLSDKDFASIEGDVPINKRFLFNDFYKIENKCLIERDKRALSDVFWGERINIQAIVGENGAGKSTLMDLMYMAINNFSYMFERGNKEKRPGASEMYYVPGLYVNLYFAFDDKTYTLVCHDDRIQLKQKNLNQEEPDIPEITIFDTLLDEIEKEIAPELKDLAKKRYKEDSEITALVENFFYTIVSNYSMQSFVDSNYKRHVYHYVDKSDTIEENLVHYNKEYIDSDYDKCMDNTNPFVSSWITPIFHKNDGYIRSIVLNPFRDEGKIDLSNEYELSKDRVCALLIYSGLKEDVFFFKPYKYLKIEAEFDLSKYLKWCNDILHSCGNNTGGLFIFDDIKYLWDKIASSLFTIQLLKAFGLNAYATENTFFQLSIIYIELKLVKITKKYPSYFEYNDLFSLELDGESYTLKVLDEKKAGDFLSTITNDKSHITKKIRRVISFLSMKTDFFLNNKVNLSIDNYKEILTNNWEKEPVISPQLIDDFLPPPFFDWQVYLNKDNEPIPYNQLSSGEIQFIQTVSIHAYHLMNLCSVPGNADRPKYKYFNLVFDEVEISFHPELQRQFLKRLIDLLKDLNLPDDHYINIIIVTHSPFILSDIPASNILFLKNGTQDNSKKRISFAQNIGEMMYDSFFMEKTIGDFAESKLKELIKWKQGLNPSMIKDEADVILSAIGDPIIRSLIDEIGKQNGEPT